MGSSSYQNAEDASVSSYRLAEDGSISPIKDSVRRKMEEVARSSNGVAWGPTATFDGEDSSVESRSPTKPPFEISVPVAAGSFAAFLATLPKWAVPVTMAAGAIFLISIPIMIVSAVHNARPQDGRPVISVAFVGNSMQYFNDLPRFMEVISSDHVVQNSCLHGDATIVNLLQTGNGMYKKFNTEKAKIEGYDDLYDFGACTVHQLLYGKDRYIYNNWLYLDESSITDDYTGVYSDGTNPCYEDPDYLQYTTSYFRTNPPQWDYIFLNDNTGSPGRAASRAASLTTLESSYVQWFEDTGAVPVFLHTHAYWTESRNMTGLVDVPTFTSLTYEGYRQYAELLGSKLPSAQQPRIAPVGIAFLTVWEEDYTMWEKLFHYDEVHVSPHGTFLQGCVVHHTLFGTMPPTKDALPESISALFSRARRMQPTTHRRKPMPTYDEAVYLYNVAVRVAAKGYLPESFVKYKNGETFETLDDDMYQ
jgi:hypothetical protein